jgi:uncharacterized Zn finger protein
VSPECEECGKDLHVDSVKRPNVDWVKVVCSSCGHITEVSMVRIGSEVSQ